MKIYVGNLDSETTESDVRDVFAQHGEVHDVTIISDRGSGRSRGFAFVEIRNEHAARAAITALDGSEIGGRHITVNEAKPREKSRSRRGR